MKKIFLPCLALLILMSCNKKQPIANPNDYNVFLNSKYKDAQVKTNLQEIEFWENKLKQDTGSFVNMMQIAMNDLANFKLTGDVNDLSKADSLFELSAAKLNNKEASMYFALAQNAITQHNFKGAYKFLDIAQKNGGEPYNVNLIRFDVNMELGNYEAAQNNLNSILPKNNNIDYLIRKAKYEDHLGNADVSIKAMEEAYNKVKNVNKKSLQNWMMTNLADMYSHSGRIEEAYALYVKALQLDSANLYALKGIATICFSNDKNAKEAKRIFKFILQNTQSPDLYLNLAEINEWEGDAKSKMENIHTFLTKIDNKKYGNMYNKYVVNLYLENEFNIAKALEIAEKEINNRATPETYTWLAFANYKANNKDKATEIINKYVLKKTHEPNALFIASIILKDSNKEMSKSLQKICAESKFELGPIKAKMLEKGI